MASQQALDSLRILAGSPGLSNSGAQPVAPLNLRRNQARVEAQAAALGIPDLADGSVSENDISDVYDEYQGNALRKLLLPVQAKGQFDLIGEQMKGQNALNVAGLTGQARIEAAKQQGANTTALINGRRDVADANIAGRADVAGMNQGATDARTAAMIKAAGLKQEMAGLQKKKYSGGLWSMIAGNPEQDADKARLAAIQAELSGMGSMAPAEEGAPPPVAPPAGGDMAARLARLRAAQGR